MKRILQLTTAALVLANPLAATADDTFLEDAVVFTNRENNETSQPSSPFFAGWQTREVPAGEYLDDGSAYESISGFNFGYQSTPNDRLQAIHTNVNVTEFQTLVSGGASAILFENSRAIVSGRALGGFAFGHDDLDDTWHTTFDLFAAGKLGKQGSNYLKVGAFVDNQDDFGKWGPALGLLLGADSSHPVTIDAAYGSGYGDPYSIGQSFYSVADDDLQIQAGIALSPSLEVGVTGQYLKWDGVFTEEEDWKTGGFVRYHSPKGFSVSLGAAGGEHGTTGFAHFTIRPKSSPSLTVGSGAKSSAKSTIDPGRSASNKGYAHSWMTAPIARQQGLQIRQENVVTEAPRGTLTCSVSDSFNSLGPLFAGVDAIHTVTYTNTGTLDQTVTINSIQNFDGTTTNVGTTATLAPGQRLTARGPETTARVIAVGAQYDQTVVITVNGQQFTLLCSFPDGSAFPTTLAPLVIAP
ncbi:MAG: hypothetical protein AAGF67_09360 [Verrucomicrobiota bacterium]